MVENPSSPGGDAPWRCYWGCNDLPAELAERYGYINRALPALLVEAHESDLSVASEVAQVRMTEALRVGAEREIYRDSPR